MKNKPLHPSSFILHPYPIDLVYFWVDGSDPKFIAAKNAAMGGAETFGAKRKTLWDESDELKYSLRSAAKFAPWINHIFIVTPDQTPKWLNTKNKKITVVSDSQIVPKKYLPTFNSATKDMFIHKIPGLSEHFLYANDDFFFGRPVTPDFFFDGAGNPIVIAKKYDMTPAIKNRPAPSMFYERMFNAARAVMQETGKQINIRLTHAIEPMRKSYVADTHKRIKNKLKISQFRRPSDMQRIVYSMMDNALGRNTIIKPTWKNNKNIWFLRPNLLCMPATFCINGTIGLNSFKHNLPAIKKLFPNKSEFEK